MTARWHVVASDRDMISLVVDLWNGHSITLTAWADDRAVMRWQGNDGRDFSDDTATSFRAWLNQAQGRT